ncbi:MAG TPA: hypothetical protein VFT37_14010, partial [Telluria sp.]|nr:hypothetical protein [Telluria sp.]
MFRLVFATALCLSSSLAFAATADDCRLAYVEPPVGSTFEWTGACKNGFADGTGVLDIKRGKMVVLHYKGEIRDGQLHGKGFMRRKDNEEYEGDFANDNPHGFGVATSRSGRYEGEWKFGRREGKGKMVFTLGGEYEGEWKNNRFHGLGTAKYISGRKVTAQFVNGLRADLPPVPKSEGKHTLWADPITGTHIRELAIRNGMVPFTQTYAGMSEADRATVRSWYPLLDDSDEPPYPLYGSRQMYKTILEVTQARSVRGVIHIVVD